MVRGFKVTYRMESVMKAGNRALTQPSRSPLSTRRLDHSGGKSDEGFADEGFADEGGRFGDIGEFNGRAPSRKGLRSLSGG